MVKIGLWQACERLTIATVLAVTMIFTSPVLSSESSSQTVSSTLNEIYQRGSLRCGVASGLEGFAQETDQGWAGFDVDFCRALAVLLFESGQKGKALELIPTTSADRFSLLVDGQIDVLVRSTARTPDRDLRQALDFAGTTFYAGMSLMGHPDLFVIDATQAPRELTACSYELLAQSPELERRLQRLTQQMNAKVEVLAFGSTQEAQEAYEAGRCDFIVGEVYTLALQKKALANPEQHQISPQRLSLEPLGPVVAQDDPYWRDLVTWLTFALIAAEEQGLNQETIEKGDALDLARLKRLEAHFFRKNASGPLQGSLSEVLRRVGSYKDIYQRNLSALFGAPGPNALWHNGGLLLSPGF